MEYSDSKNIIFVKNLPLFIAEGENPLILKNIRTIKGIQDIELYEGINLIELSIFKKIKIKLKNSNKAGFFNPKYFENYLIDLEASVLRRYFKKYKYYSPVLYLNFLVVKFKWGLGLNTNEELKLLIKCFLLRKIN
jgi:hypothetical protein